MSILTNIKYRNQVSVVRCVADPKLSMSSVSVCSLAGGASYYLFAAGCYTSSNVMEILTPIIATTEGEPPTMTVVGTSDGIDCAWKIDVPDGTTATASINHTSGYSFALFSIEVK